MSNSTISEIRPAGKRGRKPDPNALRFVSVGFTPGQRQWLRLWRQNADMPAPEEGTPDDNPTQQLQLLLEYAMKFWPTGSAFHLSRPRAPDGRFGHASGKELKSRRKKRNRRRATRQQHRCVKIARRSLVS